MRLLRLKENSQDIDSEKVQEIISQIAEKALYKPYNLKGALHSILAPLFNISGKDKEFFCSELVASVYKKAGIELFLDRLPEGTPPKFLLESIYLKDITDEVLIPFQASSLRQLGLYVKEDGDDMKRFSEIEFDIYHNLIKKIKDFCKTYNLPECENFEDVLIILNNLSSTNHTIFKELDNLFAEQLQTSGYYDLTQKFIRERNLDDFIGFLDRSISNNIINSDNWSQFYFIYNHHKNIYHERVEEERLIRKALSEKGLDILSSSYIQLSIIHGNYRDSLKEILRQLNLATMYLEKKFN
jgi:hypothetical protein